MATMTFIARTSDEYGVRCLHCGHTDHNGDTQHLLHAPDCPAASGATDELLTHYRATEDLLRQFTDPLNWIRHDDDAYHWCHYCLQEVDHRGHGEHSDHCVVGRAKRLLWVSVHC